MSKAPSNKSGPDSSPAFDPAERMAAALNEHGFLFSQQIRDRIINKEKEGVQHPWLFEAREYPVTAADGTQTRIDLVLSHSGQRGVRICLECKRALPDYKDWLVFDQGRDISGVPEQQVYFETYRLRQHPPKEEDIAHFIAEVKLPLEVFNSYLEATTERGSKKFSSSEAMEKAFLQAMMGHTGLMKKMQEYDTALVWIRSIPVVVTTAKLFRVDFDVVKLTPEALVKKEDLKATALEFCAVNYRPNDALSRVSKGRERHRKEDVANDLRFWQIRTIFVVQAQAINRFLEWAGKNLLVRLTD